MMPFDQQREPELGERVHVKPTNPAVKIQRGDGQYGKFIADDGDVLPFDNFIRARWLEGSVMIFSIEGAP